MQPVVLPSFFLGLCVGATLCSFYIGSTVVVDRDIYINIGSGSIILAGVASHYLYKAFVASAMDSAKLVQTF
jgi:hypothetical protein